MMKGWIKLHREIRDHWIFENPNFYYWWSIIIFEANHKEKKMSLGYNLYTIKKGQCSNSIRTWADLFKCSTKQVDKFFKMLEGDGMISRQILGKGKQSTTLINITNYAKYQIGLETQETTLEHTQENTKGTTQQKREELREGGTTKELNNIKLKELKNIKKTIEERKAEFKNSLHPFLDEFGSDILNEFFSYWTEHGVKDRKMRFEKEKSFGLERRLSTWLKNQKKFEKEKNSAKKENAGDRFLTRHNLQ